MTASGQSKLDSFIEENRSLLKTSASQGPYYALSAISVLYSKYHALLRATGMLTDASADLLGPEEVVKKLEGINFSQL